MNLKIKNNLYSFFLQLILFSNIFVSESLSSIQEHISQNRGKYGLGLAAGAVATGTAVSVTEHKKRKKSQKSADQYKKELAAQKEENEELRRRFALEKIIEAVKEEQDQMPSSETFEDKQAHQLFE